MKKRIMLLFFIIIIIPELPAQRKSIVIDLNYRTEIRDSKWGIGGQFKYSLTSDIRLSSDVSAFVFNERDIGLDAGLNVQYLLSLNNMVIVYPFAGFMISNHSFSADPNRRNVTDPGMNIGGGIELNCGRKSFINIDFRYNFISKDKPRWYENYALLRMGYGFRF